MKIIICSLVVILSSYCLVYAEDPQTNESSSEPLIDQLGGWIKKNNPFEKKSDTPQQVDKPIEAQLSETPLAVVAAPKNLSLNQQRLHLSTGLGNIALEANSGSVLEKNYSPLAAAQVAVTYETPVSESGSFEAGLALLIVGSKLKGSSSTKMNLSYLSIPLMYKHIVSPVRTKSSYYLKAGITPLLLLDASVDTCESVACGLDNDLDAWLTKSRSISDSFQKYSLLGTVGMGFNFHIISDFIMDSMWLNTDVSYSQGLTSINKGRELGNDVKISGVQVTLGLAATF